MNINEMKRYEKVKSKKEFYILQEPVKYENHFLNFLYVYLKFVSVEEDFFEIYGIVMNILKNFEESMFPSTILWEIEIASIITQKFSLDLSAHSKLKHDWVTYLNEVFVKAMRIVNNEAMIIYNHNNHKYKMSMPFNPSSYSILMKKAILNSGSNRIIVRQCKLTSRRHLQAEHVQ